MFCYDMYFVQLKKKFLWIAPASKMTVWLDTMILYTLERSTKLVHWFKPYVRDGRVSLMQSLHVLEYGEYVQAFLDNRSKSIFLAGETPKPNLDTCLPNVRIR